MKPERSNYFSVFVFLFILTSSLSLRAEITFNPDGCGNQGVWASSIYDDSIILGCKDSNSVFFYNYNGVGWILGGTLGISNFSIDISGNYAIVGEYSGAAYILKKEGDIWTQNAVLVPGDDGPYDDFFGYSVSISGDYAVVGAHGFNINSADDGAAYIFKRDGDNWTKQVKLIPDDALAPPHFGYSVSISGNYLIVGAPSPYGTSHVGAAYIFRRDGETWFQEAKLTASDGGQKDHFGWSVSISGDYAIVGAHILIESEPRWGAAYIFKRDGTIWTEQAKLTPDPWDAGDNFGNSVDILDDYAIITSQSNGTYIFKREQDNWTLHTKVINIGKTVTLSSDFALVGPILFDYKGMVNPNLLYSYLSPEFAFGLKHFPGRIQKENTTIHGSADDEAYWIYSVKNLRSLSTAEVTYLAQIPPSYENGFLPVILETFWLNSIDHVRSWIMQGCDVDGAVFGDSQLIDSHNVNIWTNEYYPPENNTFDILSDITSAINKQYFGIRMKLTNPQNVGSNVSIQFDIWGNEQIPIKNDGIFAGMKGDINGDKKVNLTDAILILKVLSGIVTPGEIALNYLGSDAGVKGDNKIGIEDGIYLLQELSGFYNHPPELTLISNKTIEENSELSFLVSAIDHDGDQLTYSTSTLPDGASFDPCAKSFSWIPTYYQSGIYNVTFTVSDTRGNSDSKTIAITVTEKPTVFTSPEYFPLSVGNWWDYKDDITGETMRSTITGTKSINGTPTYIYQYFSGDKEYQTSDSSGLNLHGLYYTSAEYTGDVYFDAPLLLLPNNAEVGTTQVSTTTFSFILFIPDYGNFTVHVDITSNTTFLAVEDVTAENLTLENCLKVSNQFTMYTHELDETITNDITYFWFSKDIGVVKETWDSGSVTITESYVNGMNRSY